MTGEALRSSLLALDESLANVARRLKMTPQNLDGILRTKDIKTGIIERLSKIYKKPISYFFDEGDTITVHTEGAYSPATGKGNISMDLSTTPTTLDARSSDTLLTEKIKFLEVLLTEKDERIADLKERIDELKARC